MESEKEIIDIYKDIQNKEITEEQKKIIEETKNIGNYKYIAIIFGILFILSIIGIIVTIYATRTACPECNEIEECEKYNANKTIGRQFYLRLNISGIITDSQTIWIGQNGNNLYTTTKSNADIYVYEGRRIRSTLTNKILKLVFSIGCSPTTAYIVYGSVTGTRDEFWDFDGEVFYSKNYDLCFLDTVAMMSVIGSNEGTKFGVVYVPSINIGRMKSGTSSLAMEYI